MAFKHPIFDRALRVAALLVSVVMLFLAIFIAWFIGERRVADAGAIAFSWLSPFFGVLAVGFAFSVGLDWKINQGRT